MSFRKAEDFEGTIAYKKGKAIPYRPVQAVRFSGSLGSKNED
jgi:hypothetical protein